MSVSAARHCILKVYSVKLVAAKGSGNPSARQGEQWFPCPVDVGYALPKATFGRPEASRRCPQIEACPQTSQASVAACRADREDESQTALRNQMTSGRETSAASDSSLPLVPS